MALPQPYTDMSLPNPTGRHLWTLRCVTSVCWGAPLQTLLLYFFTHSNKLSFIFLFFLESGLKFCQFLEPISYYSLLNSSFKNYLLLHGFSIYDGDGERYSWASMILHHYALRHPWKVCKKSACLSKGTLYSSICKAYKVALKSVHSLLVM